MTSPRAGQPATSDDLIDVAALIAAYYDRHPDVSQPEQRVSFGTSGHRGSSLNTTFNEDHILATSQAIVEYRARAGLSTVRCTSEWTRTRCPSRPPVRRWRCSPPTRSACFVDSRGGYTPTPSLSRAILAYNQGRTTHLADGVVVTPSHNPPSDGGYKYNPPDGGPAGTDITGWIQDRANELLAGGLREVKRIPYEQAIKSEYVQGFDFLDNYVAALPGVIDMEAIGVGRRPDRRRSARRRVGGLLGRDRVAVRPRADRGQPDGGPAVRLHDAGLGRQDPDGLLVAVGDGLA